MGLWTKLASSFTKPTLKGGWGTDAAGEMLQESAKSSITSKEALQAAGNGLKAGVDTAKNNWGKGILGYFGYQGYQGYSAVGSAVSSAKGMLLPVALVGAGIFATYVAFKGLFGSKTPAPEEAAQQAATLPMGAAMQAYPSHFQPEMMQGAGQVRATNMAAVGDYGNALSQNRGPSWAERVSAPQAELSAYR